MTTLSAFLEGLQAARHHVHLREGARRSIGPAFKKKDPEMESAYYYAPADRRNHRGWVTVMRDNEAIAADVELFQRLLDMKVSEREMQRFFEENPFFLSQLRLGIQVPHPSVSYASVFAGLCVHLHPRRF